MPFRFWFYACKLGLPLIAAVGFVLYALVGGVILEWYISFAVVAVVGLGITGAVMGLLMAFGRPFMRCPECGRFGRTGGSRSGGMWIECDSCGCFEGAGPFGLRIQRTPWTSHDAPHDPTLPVEHRSDGQTEALPTTQQSSTPAYWINEMRSDRSAYILLFCVVTSVSAMVGAMVIVGATLATKSPIGARLLVGGIFGLGFLVLFGLSAVHLWRRFLRAPQLVVVDATGVRVGDRGEPWDAIRCVWVFEHGLRKRETAVIFPLKRGGSVTVPGAIPLDLASSLDTLDRFLSAHGIDVPIALR